jgi:hypothetical protein
MGRIHSTRDEGNQESHGNLQGEASHRPYTKTKKAGQPIRKQVSSFSRMTNVE